MSLNRFWFLTALGVCAGVVACGGHRSTGPTQSADPPSIACPIPPPPVESLDGSAQPVSYPAPTVSGGQSPVNTSCLPVSGSAFPIGTDTVTCTTSDARARSATCTFPVVVEPPPVLTVKSFVAFGDSITWGEDGTSAASIFPEGQRVFIQLPQDERYPDILQQELRARYQQQQQLSVKNAGCPGEELSKPGVFNPSCFGERADDPSALARFNSIVSLHQFDVALFMEGSNDVNDAPGDSKAIPTAVGYLQKMIDLAKANGMKVIVATIPPMVPPGIASRTLGASFVPTFNDQVRGLATSEGVPLADVYAAFGSDATLIGFDGLHPTPAGYRRIADTLLTAIKGSLEAQPSGIPASLRRR